MRRCLGCKGNFQEEDMVYTNSYLGQGVMSDLSGYYCKNCVGDKKICTYCGVPSEIVYEDDSDFNNLMKYCQECFDEIEEYLE